MMLDEAQAGATDHAEVVARGAPSRSARRSHQPSPEARVAGELRSVLMEVSTIADRMRTMMALFLDAACGDDTTHLRGAAHLVVDVVRDQADQLDALETRASALYAPIIARRVE